MKSKTIGASLAACRRSRHMTQEAVGERLGVTSKTVSRWETGAVLPDLVRLTQLSQLYGISVDDLISDDGNISANQSASGETSAHGTSAAGTPVLDTTAPRFPLSDRIDYFRRKWLCDHRAVLIFSASLFCAVAAGVWILGRYVTIPVCIIGGVLLYVFFYNRMRKYVERNAFDGKR